MRSVSVVIDLCTAVDPPSTPWRILIDKNVES